MGKSQLPRRVFGSDDIELHPCAGPGFVAGDTVDLFLDAAGASPATDLTDMAGHPMRSGQVTVSPHGRLPLFMGPPDGTETLYVRVRGGAVTPIHAQVGFGSLADTVSSVDGLTGAVDLTGKYRRIVDAEDLYAKKTEVPTLDELTFTTYVGSVTFGTTARVDWNTSFSASLWVAPFDLRLVTAYFAFDFWTLAGSDTNWWNLILRRHRNNVPADIATRTTRLTGGTNGVNPRTGYNFNTVPFNVPNSMFQPGDVCVMAFTFTGIPANLLLPCTVTTRWQPV